MGDAGDRARPLQPTRRGRRAVAAGWPRPGRRRSTAHAIILKTSIIWFCFLRAVRNNAAPLRRAALLRRRQQRVRRGDPKALLRLLAMLRQTGVVKPYKPPVADARRHRPDSICRRTTT